MWLGFCTANAGGTGSIHGQGTVIPHATTKTWCSQKERSSSVFGLSYQILFLLGEFIFWLSTSVCSNSLPIGYCLSVKGKVYRNKMGMQPWVSKNITKTFLHSVWWLNTICPSKKLGMPTTWGSVSMLECHLLSKLTRQITSSTKAQ